MKKNDFGQYFTPPHIVNLMVGMLTVSKDSPILEPSAGEGIFLDVLQSNSYTNCCGIEIDSSLTKKESHKIINTSFVSWNVDRKYSAIIGNPPYIRWRNLDQDLQDEVKAHKMWGELFNSLSDYLSVFIVNSILNLADGGELIFITPSFWMHTKHASKLRDWMLQQGSIVEIVDFGESKVFPKVSSAIIIFKYIKNRQVADIQYSKFIGGRIVNPPVDKENIKQFEMMKIPAFKKQKHWTLATKETQEKLSVLERNACVGEGDSFSFLGEYVDIANGMVSGLDKAFRIPSELHSCLTNKEIDEAVINVLKAKNLGVLAPTGISHYIDIPIGLSEEVVREQYPNLLKHLEQFKDDLLKRYSYGKELPYWEWAFRRSEKFLLSKKSKGFVPCKERLTNKRVVRFTLAASAEVATQDVTAFAPKKHVRESIEYIIGYLSLPEVSDWIRIKGLMKGGIAEFSEKPLSEIPFRTIDWSNPKDVELHDKIKQIVINAYKTDKTINDDVVDLIAKIFRY